jgi:hypothetical protein
MRHLKIGRPSAGVILGSLALFIALSGSALAAPVVNIAKSVTNSASVDGISASKKPKAGQLLALDKNKQFPASVIPAAAKGTNGTNGAKGDKGDPGDTNVTSFHKTVDHAGTGPDFEVTLGTWGSFTLVGKCTGTDSAPAADVFLRTSADNAAFTDYNNAGLSDFDIASGDKEVEYGSSSANPNAPDMEGPYDGTFAATSADLQTYITGSITTGTYIGGPTSPPCFFGGFVAKG